MQRKHITQGRIVASFLYAIGLGMLFPACSSSNGGSTGTVTGGATSGGAPSSGGLANTGGVPSAGGVTTTGGATQAGGHTTVPSGTGHYQMENLDRGVVAVVVSGGVYVGWRMFGYEYDTTASNVSYNLYKGGAKLANVTDSTNYLDAAGVSGSSNLLLSSLPKVGKSSELISMTMANEYLVFT